MGKDGRSGSDVLLLDAIDVELEIAEVILADAELKDFVDDRQQVVERTDRLERDGVGRAKHAAGGRQHESVFDSCHRYAAIIKNSREETIIEANSTGGSRRPPISIQHFADVIVFRDLHGCRSRVSALGLAQRGSINANGVAVVAQSAQ